MPALYGTPSPGRYDEMVDDAGQVRPLWSNLSAELATFGADGLARRSARISRVLHGHGRTFEIHADSEDTWSLDPVPHLMTSAAFDALRVGVEQRSRLLNAVLHDLHGDQRLLRDGVVPADVVLRHREFLRPCLDVPAGAVRLVFHGVDVVHTAHGYLALADRCESPAGAGYALENRQVLGGSYPDVIRRLGVRPVADWFETVRNTLGSLAPAHVTDPRIVLFTAGPESRSYFEQSFLARSLGYSVVESEDLTVRNGKVWLKAVGGLEPVHVILRRIRSRQTDPLELRSVDGRGVAGLVEACRRGTVAVANPIGSAAASNPALLPFLPAVSKALLGEDLLLPTVDTWWCGQRNALDHVIANLGSLVVKPVERPRNRSSLFGRLLSDTERDDLIRRLRAEPHAWVAQREVELPTGPGFTDGEIAPCHLLQRAFSVADTAAGPGAYAVMPGALSRSGPQPESITIFGGGASKDTWVLDPGHGGVAVRRRVVLPQVDLRRSLPSRVAESMFWIGRNLERAEAVVRLVTAVDTYLEQWPDLVEEADGAWATAASEAVVGLVGGAPTGPGSGDGRPDGPGSPDAPRSTDVPASPDLPGLLVSAIADLDRPASLATSLRFLLLGSQTVRELFSTDSWRMLTELDRLAGDLTGGLDRVDDDGVIDLAGDVITPIAALSGLLTESMVRDPGWRFLDTGRRLERARLAGQLLQASMVDGIAPVVAGQLHEMVLTASESIVAYRRRHRSDIQVDTMLSLLVLDPSNPRSIRSSLDALVADLEAVEDYDRRGPELSDIGRRAAAQVAATGPELLAAHDGVLGDTHGIASPAGGSPLPGPHVHRKQLDTVVTEVHHGLDEIVHLLGRRFFSHVRATTIAGTAAKLPHNVPGPEHG